VSEKIYATTRDTITQYDKCRTDSYLSLSAKINDGLS